MGSRITLGSNTGTDLVNLQGGALQWSPVQVGTVNAVSSSIAQGTPVDAAQFDECFTLLSEAFDGNEFSDVGQMIQEAYQCATPQLKFRIAGFFAMLYPDFMRALLESDSVASEVVGRDGIKSVYNIMNESDNASKIDGLLSFCREYFDIVPNVSTDSLEAEILRKGEGVPGDPPGPVLWGILKEQNTDRMRESILDAGESGTLEQLAKKLAHFEREAVMPLLNGLLQEDSQLGQRDTQWVFDLMARVSDLQEDTVGAQTETQGTSSLASELRDMDRDVLEQLLLSPVSPDAIAQSYYPPAFCSHVMGLLVRD
jgi:hypothetical protein